MLNKSQTLLNLMGWLAVAGLMAIPMVEAQEPLSPDNAGARANTIAMEAGFLNGATIKDSSGKVEVSSLDAIWSWSFLSLEYQGKSYDWESAGANPFSSAQEPIWNTLNTVWLTAGYSNSINGSLGYAVDADIFVSFEGKDFGLVGNDVEGTLFYSLPAGWRAYGGMSVHHSPFQTDLYPVFGLIHGDESEPGWAITAGIPETKVQYRFNSKYSVKTGFSILNVDYYALSVGNEEHARYLETSDNRLFLLLNVSPSRALQVGAGIQYAVDDKMIFYDANRQNSNTYRLSSVPGFLFQIQYRF